ncbi:MAG: BON domain-containing protein [Acidobacteriia bacterium]|nr:BON domain-containing protein [Terriglobia bacterium]
MKTRLLSGLLLASAFLWSAGVAASGTAPSGPEAQTDAAIANRVQHEIRMYPYYGIWDDVQFQVANGHVSLTGAVTQPYKKDAIGSRVQQVAGVTSLTNQLEVLPLSPMDDGLRLRLARAIYSDPVLSRYAMQAVPPIHIIVDNGHVTLNGVVRTSMEKEVAGLRAASAGLSFGPITNNLRVEMPAKKS